MVGPLRIGVGAAGFMHACRRDTGALIDPDPAAGRTVGAVRGRERLGGLLRYYYRAAA